MGAFFSNIQVKTPIINDSQSREQIIDYIKQLHLENGYIEVDNADVADKSVIVSALNDTSWIAVYDEDAESQKLSQINSLAISLAKRLQSIALSISVGDSDCIYIGLNNDESTIDSISNSYDNLEVDFSKIQTDEWEKLIIDKSYSFEDIKTAWKNKDVFVESFLDIFVKLYGISEKKLLTGYEYLSENSVVDGTQLYFVKKKKPADNTPIPVSLNLACSQKEDKFKVGPSAIMTWGINNYGDASEGFDIMICGDAIENNLIKPVSVKIKHGVAINIAWEIGSTFIETKSQADEKLYYINFDKFKIHKGDKLSANMSQKEFHRVYKIIYENLINIEMEFLAVNAGESEFKLFIVPHENRGDGTYSTYVPISIS